MQATQQQKSRSYKLSILIGIFWIVRAPVLCVLSLAIVLDLRLSHAFSWPSFTNILPLVLLLYGGGFAFNDYADFLSDRVNLPLRPLPAGRLSRDFVLGLSSLMSLLALAWALRLNATAVWYALLFSIVSYAYSLWIKPYMVVLKNFSAALLSSSVFIFLGLYLPESQASWYFWGAAMMLGIAREIVMDLRDIHGDLKSGTKTVATFLGLWKAGGLAALFATAGIAWIFIPITHWGFHQVLLPWRTIGFLTGILMLSVLLFFHLEKGLEKTFWMIGESMKLYWLLILIAGLMSNG